jgi:hypothetical protein
MLNRRHGASQLSTTTWRRRIRSLFVTGSQPPAEIADAFDALAGVSHRRHGKNNAWVSRAGLFPLAVGVQGSKGAVEKKRGPSLSSAHPRSMLTINHLRP